ncbi:MAG: hypothetical protein WEA58_13725 [Balneolaceae bacterium]
MEILKHIACRVLAPLLLTAAGLLMIVVVPMNASEYMQEEVGVENPGIHSESEIHQNKGLIYMEISNESVDKSNSVIDTTESALSR